MTPTVSNVQQAKFEPTADINKLNRENEYYSREKGNWVDYDLLSRGGPALKLEAARMLVKGEKEMQDVHLERCKRFTYQNIMGTVIGWYVSKLFQTDPEIHFRKAGSQDAYAGKNKDWYSGFLKNCDKSGTTFVDLWRTISSTILTLHDAWVCIDLPHSEDGAYASKQQQRQAGALDPYVMWYDPRNVINWQVDAYGNFEWVVIRNQGYKQEFLGAGKFVETWYYYNRTQYAVYEVERDVNDSNEQTTLVDASGAPLRSGSNTKAELIADGEHALAQFKQVPVRYINVPDALHLACRAYLPALAHLNIENDFYYCLHRGNVPMPVFYTEAEIYPTVAATGYFQFKPGDRAEWMEPRGAAYATNEKVLADLRQEIYRQMYLTAQGRDSSAAAAAASGVSKEVDMLPAREVLSALGDNIRAQMQLVLGDVAKARGDADIEFDVRGMNFLNNPAIQEAEIAEIVDLLDIQSDTLDKEKQKKVAISYLRDSNPSITEKVVAEIDAAPTKSELEKQEQQLMLQKMTANVSQTRSANRGVSAVASEASGAA